MVAWWRQPKPEPTPEAVKARHEAEEGLEDAKRKAPVVRAVAASLRNFREGNEDEWAQRIEALIRRGA